MTKFDDFLTERTERPEPEPRKSSAEHAGMVVGGMFGALSAIFLAVAMLYAIAWMITNFPT